MFLLNPNFKVSIASRIEQGGHKPLAEFSR